MNVSNESSIAGMPRYGILTAVVLCCIITANAYQYYRTDIVHGESNRPGHIFSLKTNVTGVFVSHRITITHASSCLDLVDQTQAWVTLPASMRPLDTRMCDGMVMLTTSEHRMAQIKITPEGGIYEFRPEISMDYNCGVKLTVEDCDYTTDGSTYYNDGGFIDV